MSSKSRRQIGWLSTILALFTIGLAKPDSPIAKETASEPKKSLEASAIPAEAPVALSISQPVTIEKTFNWDKAREFRLSARLSITAQLNRPKIVEREARKIKTVASPAPRWNRTVKSIPDTAQSNGNGAVVIKFPAQGAAETHLSEAA